jgi:signal transduction histidine kinase
MDPPVGSLSESLPPLLAALVAFAIGASVLLRDRKRDEFLLFAVFCFNLGFFHFTSFFYVFSKVALFEWLAKSMSLVLPWTADRCFAYLVPNMRSRPRRGISTALMVLVLLLHMLGLFALLREQPNEDAAILGISWAALTIALDFYVAVALLLVAQRMWRATQAAQGTAAASRMRYLFYASLVALIFGSPLIPAIGPIVTAVYLYFVAQALVRERLLDLPEIVSRIATLTALVITLTVLFGALILMIPADAEERFSLTIFNIAVASYAVIVLIDPVRSEFESWIEKLLFRERSHLRTMLLGLRRRLVNLITPDEMSAEVIETLRASDRVTRASLYLLDNEGRYLVLRGELGTVVRRRIDIATRRPLLERACAQGWVLRDVVQREYQRAEREAKAELGEVLDAMTEVGASLAIALVEQGEKDPALPPFERLVGALFIDDERLIEPFSMEEVELFQEVGAQAAITLQNSNAFERRNERERLAALGEMSAGLAHEIRNPLGAIRGAVQVIQPQLEADPTVAEFMNVIVEEVDRLNRVVTQFLSYSRRYKLETGPVDLHRVIEATCRLLPSERSAQVTVSVENEVPTIAGDAEALRQVLHNLVLNALDATSTLGGEGRVLIGAAIRRRGLASGDAVALRVQDNGPGLSPHTLSHLFVPFHTTKSGGTGLGLPICQRIVETHHGILEATNADGGGACFTVVLPLQTPEKDP